MGKYEREKKILNFFGQKFLTWTFPKFFFNGVFELPLLRNAQKRHKKNKNKIGTYLPHLVAICQIYVAFNFFSLGRPLAGAHLS